MPQNANTNKTDLSVSIGATLRKRFLKACEIEEISLSEATRIALKRWLSAMDRAKQRQSVKKGN